MSAQIIQFPTPKPVAPFKTLDDAAWYSNFGKRLATIRKLLELSKPQMAAVFGVHPVTYHLWEGGYRARKAHQGLGRLSREHGVNLAWLLEGKGEPFQQRA
jgi:transcriptional regulator with XRE-family HTH domain